MAIRICAMEYWTAAIHYEGNLWVKPEEVGLRGKYTDGKKTLFIDVITL
jgi:hypothetical protein